MIVACPGCQSRYDVTGRPPGTRARCRCGEVFELPCPSQQAAAMACPTCGGQVAPTNHACEFCAAHLLVKACPRCFARIFHGHKHCHACGASTTEAAKALDDGRAAPLQCPRCDDALEGRLVEDVLLDECNGCHGVWIDATALERILQERRRARADAILGRIDGNSAAPDAAEKPKRMYIRCPECDIMMNRRLFASGAGIVVDVCRHHGTWFDESELQGVVDFVMKGGLERAAVKDARRALDQARSERQQARIDAIRSERVQSTDTYRKYSGLFSALGSIIG